MKKQYDSRTYTSRMGRYIRSVRGKLKGALKKYDEDKVEGEKYLMNLLVATGIRAIIHVKPLKPMSVKNTRDDEKNKLVQKIMIWSARASQKHIEQAKNWMVEVLERLP
jgi:predicted transcriptional regulator with HTH domain